MSIVSYALQGRGEKHARPIWVNMRVYIVIYKYIHMFHACWGRDKVIPPPA